MWSCQTFVARNEDSHPVTTADTKAVLLVGGLGTRLRAVVPSAPKAMAPVGDRPFLELLIRQLESQGIRNLVLCTGYLADQIEGEFGDGSDLGVAIEYLKEPQPLGTGGALKFADRLLRGVLDFVVMNGDSFVEVDLRQLLQFHHAPWWRGDDGGRARRKRRPLRNCSRGLQQPDHGVHGEDRR